MPTVPPPSRRRIATLLGLAAAVAGFSGAPASASYCPAGTDYVTDYCVNAALFDDLVLSDNPEAWYRLGDAQGATTMADSSGNNHHGEYKNRQDSGPVGIAANDPDTSRDFWGSSGYGFVNGIRAPGSDNGYWNYTMEAWFFQKDTDSNPAMHDDATIMQFGGAGALYIKNNTVRFRNGPNDEILAPGAFLDEQWYMVVGRRTGSTLELWLRASPTVPTFFNPAPDATGTSLYRPGGSPTFYVGYGEYAPWFNGALDEAIYYDHAVAAHRFGYHYYADPAPPTVLNRGARSTPASKPAAQQTGKAPSKATKKAKLAKARANVKRLSKLIKKAKRWIGSLNHHNAPAKAVKRARATLKSLQRQLRAARAKVKRLS